MRYYVIVEQGFIMMAGIGLGGAEISEERYNDILTAIHNKPPCTETTDYMLREDLTWEQVSVEPPTPDPDPEIDEYEAWEILFGEEEA